MSRIIVGVEGSENGAIALQWAVEAGRKRGDEVIAVLAWTFFDQGYRPTGAEMQPEFTAADADRVLANAVEAAGLTGQVTQKTIKGTAPEAMAEFAEPDDLLVIGARGLGGFEGMLLGSVSQRMLELAPCPVAVIRPEGSTSPEGPIVVGVDGSELSTRALHWAATHARATGNPIRIVHAWQWPVLAEITVPEVFDALEAAARERLEEAAADPALEGLEVQAETVNSGAARALLAHDTSAAMIVVANRGLGTIKRVFLGSTSRQLTLHATCPVVVVPGRD